MKGYIEMNSAEKPGSSPESDPGNSGWRIFGDTRNFDLHAANWLINGQNNKSGDIEQGATTGSSKEKDIVDKGTNNAGEGSNDIPQTPSEYGAKIKELETKIKMQEEQIKQLKEEQQKNLLKRVKNALAGDKNKPDKYLQVKTRDEADRMGKVNPYQRVTLSGDYHQAQFERNERKMLKELGIEDEKTQNLALRKNLPANNKDKEIQKWWGELNNEGKKEILEIYANNKSEFYRPGSNYGQDFAKFLDEQLNQQSNERIAELENLLNQQKQAEQPIPNKEGESRENTAKKQDTQSSSGGGHDETTASQREEGTESGALNDKKEGTGAPDEESSDFEKVLKEITENRPNLLNGFDDFETLKPFLEQPAEDKDAIEQIKQHLKNDNDNRGQGDRDTLIEIAQKLNDQKKSCALVAWAKEGRFIKN